MARYKSILIGMRTTKAGRKRKCYHSKKHVILQGERLIEVKAGMGWHGYCVDCAAKMIEDAQDNLKAFASELYA